MQLTKKQLYIGGGLVLILAVVYAIVRSVKNKKDKVTLEQMIAENTGGTGNSSVDNVLGGVKPASYGSLDIDCKTIYEARGWWWWLPGGGDEKAVYSLLSKRTKNQIAAIKDRFPQLYQDSFESYLDSFLSDAEMRTLADIIANAK